MLRRSLDQPRTRRLRRLAASVQPTVPIDAAIQVEPGAQLASTARCSCGASHAGCSAIASSRTCTSSCKAIARASNAVSFVIDRGQGERAERRVDNGPADCDQFHSALALSIALAIDATLARREREARQAENLPSDEELLTKPERPEPAYFRLAFGVFGQATAGLLTNVSAALSGRLEIGFIPWLDLRFGGITTALQDQNFPKAPGTFRSRSGRASRCVPDTHHGQ